MRVILFILLSVFITAVVIGKGKRPVTIEDLWNMNRITGYSIAPDGEHIIYSVKKYNMEMNSGETRFYLTTNSGKVLRELSEEADISEASFLPNGKIVFVKNRTVYTTTVKGTGSNELFGLYSGISGIVSNNNASLLLFTSSVYPDCNTQECNQQKDEEAENNPVKAQIFDELLYKHWNSWRGKKRSHLFLYDTKTDKVMDLTPGATFDVPPLALGGVHDYNFSGDGNSITFAANVTDFPADNTNNDIFEIDVENVLKGHSTTKTSLFENKGNDTDPVYSPDNKKIAFCSMKRPGFEADKRRLMIKEIKSGKVFDITIKYDISVGEFIWAPDSKEIYFTAANEIYNSIYKINVSTSELTTVLEKVTAGNLQLDAKGKTLFYTAQSSTKPVELFALDLATNKSKQVTHVNAELLSEMKWNEVETFWSEGAEGTKVQSIMVKPPDFDPKKKYPLMFLIHGGPQGHWSDNFHYRWNLQMFAAPGYVVVAPNPRGSTGYGQKFTDEISQDWGGKVYIDLMNAYDYAIENYDFIDKENTFAAGASYGGYMINWIEGHTDRFNALICHAGVFNLESMYGVTEELWFPEWEMGGTPWENRDLYKKWSPHTYVENFKTPMLVVHGANDFRVPEGQAFELFTSLQKMGVDSKLLYFPDEYHFVVKPQNARLWWNEIYKWLDNYKKAPETKDAL